MDVSRYEFACQKALHQGLQYARSLGHQQLEVEHVALALLRADAISLKGGGSERLKRHLENHLQRTPRIYGTVKIDATRMNRDVPTISKEVVQHLTDLLTANVDITLEIQAQVPEGIPENIVRTITENCRTLKFKDTEFTKE